MCSYASQFVIVFYQFLAVFLVDFRFEDIRIFMFTAFQNPILSNRLVNFLFCIFPFQDFNKDSNTISISNLHLTFNCIWLRVSNQICLWGFLFIIILANIYVHSDFVRNKPAKVNFSFIIRFLRTNLLTSTEYKLFQIYFSVSDNLLIFFCKNNKPFYLICSVKDFISLFKFSQI